MIARLQALVQTRSENMPLVLLVHTVVSRLDCLSLTVLSLVIMDTIAPHPSRGRGTRNFASGEPKRGLHGSQEGVFGEVTVELVRETCESHMRELFRRSLK